MAISLQKGQKISLEKEAGRTLTKVVMGLGWDVAKKGGLFGFFSGSQNIDLDASCFLFDEQNQLVDLVYFGQLRSKDGSIQHTGDNLTGEGDGDDEQIIVNLDRIPAYIKSLVFTVSSYRGQSFKDIENAFCRITDNNNKEIARYNLSAQGNHTAQVMAKVYRHNGEWKMHAIGENSQGATPDKIVPVIYQFL